ncbi:MAG: hypothetical protein WCV79_02300 [Candidatus Paceibacterota bacterium]|jgi:hypothetical protein
MNTINCKKHLPYIFQKTSKDQENQVVTRQWDIVAVCATCGTILAGDELKQSLGNKYAPEVADLVYKAYTNKLEFYSMVTTLSKMGINVTALLRDERD